MHIYIDESGIFSNPANKNNVASCVAALVIPSSYKVKLFKEFGESSKRWPKEAGEVKGKLLNEDEIEATLRLLRRYDAIVEIAAIDMGLHTQQELKEFQHSAYQQIAGWNRPENPTALNEAVAEIADDFSKASTQEFAEAYLLLVMLLRVLYTATNYYARRLPKELKSFHWTMDAKQPQVTLFERAWRDVLFPSVEHQSKLNPLRMIQGGDYSYFERFFTDEERAVERLGERARDNISGVIGIKLEEIFGKSFKFENSQSKVGLQLADIVANATQRALNGKLQERGWIGVGNLMVAQEHSGFQMILLDPKAQHAEIRTVETPFSTVIDKLLGNAKPLWLPPDHEALLISKGRRREKLKRRISGNPMDRL